MTFNKLYETWTKNINSEYILPTLDKFYDNNIIISTENDIEEILRQIKYYKKIFKIKLKQKKENK